MATTSDAGCLARALARWQHAAGQYWLYVCSAPFVGDSIATGRPAYRRRSRLVVDAVRSIPSDERAAVFIDLPTRLSLPSTEPLNDLGFVVVPVIQRWVTESAILRSDRLIASLARFGARVRQPRPERGVIFLLDGERAGPVRLADSTAAARTFDNRYRYPTCRFPPPSRLREDGITGIWWLAPNGVADDLKDYADRMSAEGFSPRPLLLANSRSDLAITDCLAPEPVARGLVPRSGQPDERGTSPRATRRSDDSSVSADGDHADGNARARR